MVNDISDQLRESLHRGADAMPYGPDLTQGAIARARVIRRRRRTVAAATTIAVLALGIPLGLQLGDGATRSDAPVATEPTPSSEPTGPQAVRLDLAGLSPGALPRVPFRSFDAYNFDGGSHDLGGLDPYDLAGWDGGGVMRVMESGSLTLYLTSPNGPPEPIAEGVVASMAASSDGRWLAYVANGTLVLRDAEDDGTSSSSEAVEVPEAAEIVEVSDGRVLMAPPHGPTLLYRAGELLELGITNLTAWSPSAGLFANIDEVTDLVATSAISREGGELLWRSDDWQVDHFSPDGRWAYALPSYLSGYGPVEVAVLEASTGDVVRTARFGSGDEFFGVIRDAAWESDNQLLLRVESDPRDDGTQPQDGTPPPEVALVRLEVLSGKAELATTPMEVQGFADNRYLLS